MKRIVRHKGNLNFRGFKMITIFIICLVVGGILMFFGAMNYSKIKKFIRTKMCRRDV